jgi:hypothetical protein
MEFGFNRKPATHILHHLIRDKSGEPLVAFQAYNRGEHQYDNHLLLVTPSTALSVDLDREQAADLIDVLRVAFELDGAVNGEWECNYRCYALPSHDVDSPSRSKKRKKRKK